MIRECGISRLKTKLQDQPEELSALDQMLSDKNLWPNKLLSRVLDEEGYKISVRVVEHHRAKDCKCR